MNEIPVTPQWIDATKRQPPDAWPRPVVEDDSITGHHFAVRRFQNGQWWWQNQFREETTDRVLFWMEVYPLPDGTRPKGLGLTKE